MKRLHTISLLQLDQINTELDFESKAGAEIYYRELNNSNPRTKCIKIFKKSIINLHTNLESSPASVSEAVLQIYKRSRKATISKYNY